MFKSRSSQILLTTILAISAASLYEAAPWESAGQKNAKKTLAADSKRDAVQIQETVAAIQNPDPASYSNPNDTLVDQIANDATQLSIMGPQYVDGPTWKQTEQALEVAYDPGKSQLNELQRAVVGNSIRQLQNAGFAFGSE